MAWNPYTSPIDYVVIQGNRTPGITQLVGASGPLKWDEQVGYGYSGSFLIFRGSRLGRFATRSYLYTEQDWDDYHDFLPTVRPPTQRYPKALEIWHPFLEDLKIKSAVPEEVKQPEEQDPGVYMWEVKWVQHRRPKLTLVKPEDSKDAHSQDPVDQAIESLTAAAQAKRDQLAGG